MWDRGIIKSMGTVIVLLVLVFVVAPIAAGWLGFVAFLADKRQREQAAKGTGSTLEALFDGRQTVSYDSRRSASLRSTVVVEGALRRGYELVHDDNGQLLFKRTQSSSTT